MISDADNMLGHKNWQYEQGSQNEKEKDMVSFLQGLVLFTFVSIQFHMYRK